MGNRVRGRGKIHGNDMEGTARGSKQIARFGMIWLKESSNSLILLMEKYGPANVHIEMDEWN